MEYVKFQKLRLKNHPEFNEKWLQKRIAEDSSILGLGELILKDEERLQPLRAALISCYKTQSPAIDMK